MADYDERLRMQLERLGERIRTERLRVGASQEDLADRAGMHRTYVGSVERGERNLSIGSLFRIADALGVRTSELVAEE